MIGISSAIGVNITAEYDNIGSFFGIVTSSEEEGAQEASYT